MTRDILIIDDELDIRNLISDGLKDEGFSSRAVANSSEAFEAIRAKIPSAVILDIWLQGSDLDGLGILEIIKKQYPLMPVVVISGHGTVETAVSAIKMGAYDYLEKPFTHDKLMIVLRRACEASRLRKENIDLKSKVVDKTEFVGASVGSAKLQSDIEKVAPTSSRVMIHGQFGSGKELCARLIHKKSKRSGSFIVFNPTAMTAERINQELFDIMIIDKKTSLLNKRISVLEAANNGTLYIDEIGDLTIAAQKHLLQFLENNTLVKANNKSVKLNVRIITATTKNLEKEIAQGKFRQDLYYRLNIVPINVPTLASRKDDIPVLVDYFIKQLVEFSGLKYRLFSDEAIAALQSYDWPGNIRQLRNVIEWALIMNPTSINDTNAIKSDMLPQDIINNTVSKIKADTSNIDMMSIPLREAREVFERQYLSAQMNRFNNNISKTSNFVGMERSALHRKLKMLNLHTAKNASRASEKEFAIL